MELKLINFIPKTIIPRIGGEKELYIFNHNNQFLLNSKRCKKVVSIPKTINLTENDIISIGLYLAEGQKYINFDRKTHHGGEIEFSNSELISLKLFCCFINKLGIHTKNLEWRIHLNINYGSINKKELFNYWLTNLNLNPKKARPKWFIYTGAKGGRLTDLTSKYGCMNLIYGSVIFRNFLLNFINKFFEDAIKNKNKKILGLILKGYFAGDGHVTFNLKPHRRKSVSFGVKDKKLLIMIRKSLEIIGLHSIKETHPETTKTNSKSIVVYNIIDFRILDFYDIPNLVLYKKDKFFRLLKSYKMPLPGLEPRTLAS